MKSTLFLLALTGWATVSAAQAPKKFKLPSVLNEVSGLYLENDSTFWWHNDSGNEPILYQTNAEGQLRDSLPFPSLKNRDWEDITADPAGYLYIGDFGNNCNCRKNLLIYRYHFQDKSLDSIEFVLADQLAFPPKKADWNFDLEAMLWFKDTLHLFSKNSIGQGNDFTKHYKLPAQPGSYTAQVVDSLYLKKRVVTAAAVSPDGTTVGLLAYHFKRILGVFPTSKASLFLLDGFSNSDFLSGSLQKKSIPPYFIATQLEALDFLDGSVLYVASEKTIFIKPRAKRLRYR